MCISLLSGTERGGHQPRAAVCASAACAGLGDQLLLFKKFQTQSTHGRQLALKLTMGFFPWENVKQVWQLHTVAHDRISSLVAQLFTDEQTILCVEENPQGVGSAEQPVGE
jgi:hypothetical protein